MKFFFWVDCDTYGWTSVNFGGFSFGENGFSGNREKSVISSRDPGANWWARVCGGWATRAPKSLADGRAGVPSSRNFARPDVCSRKPHFWGFLRKFRRAKSKFSISKAPAHRGESKNTRVRPTAISGRRFPPISAPSGKSPLRAKIAHFWKAAREAAWRGACDSTRNTLPHVPPSSPHKKVLRISTKLFFDPPPGGLFAYFRKYDSQKLSRATRVIQRATRFPWGPRLCRAKRSFGSRPKN